MRVIVAAVAQECPAHLALTMEGVKHEVVICDGEVGYGRMLAKVWQQGEGFVLVEHDVVPWPTAVASLVACPFQWCSFEYPMGHGLGDALGCVKFGTALTRRFPDLPDAWAGVPWQNVDGHLEPALRKAYMVTVHQHVPPVAHVKRKG